jgi:predicted phosphodiesterase
MPTKFSDDEFISAWKRLGSPASVAKALGLDLRGVYARRKSIEDRHGILLETLTEGHGGRPKIEVPKQGFRALAEKVTGTVIIGSDGHFWPGERSVAFGAMVELIKDMKPSMIIMNGDSFDGARISRHLPGGWANLPDVADELDAVKERHGEIERIAPADCPLIWPAGNHDSRFTARLAQGAPEYVRVHGFDIADHFPAWQFCWSIHINNHTVVKHRHHQGLHGAYQNTLKGGKTIVTGHTHRLQAVQWADYNGLRWGIECGTLSDFGPSNDKFAYGEDNPSNWSQGFAVLTFTDSGALLEPEFCRVINGTAYFRGQSVYSASGSVKIMPQKSARKKAA